MTTESLETLYLIVLSHFPGAKPHTLSVKKL
jgi:hypothetical protein